MTVPVLASATVVPVFVVSTCSSLTGVTVMAKLALVTAPTPSSTLKSKLSAAISEPSWS